MRIQIDPQRREVRALRRAAEWRGRRVLELGCGDGRVTLRLAGLGASVTAIDPDRESIRAARRQVPARLAGQVRYRVGTAEHLDCRDESFHTVIFSWSL